MPSLSKVQTFAIARQAERGVVLVLSLVFLAVFAAMGLALGAATGLSLQTAVNYKASNRARTAAESGLEVVRYWLSEVSLPESTGEEQYLQALAEAMDSVLERQGISIVCPFMETDQIRIPRVPIDAERYFDAVLNVCRPDAVQVKVRGFYAGLTKTVSVQYELQPQTSGVFNYGLATKGPLSMNGNVSLVGVHAANESDVYIESPNDITALRMNGSGCIAGDVSIARQDAVADISGSGSVGGQTGLGVHDHIRIGVPSCQFPEPDVGSFEGFATSVISDSKDLKKVNTLVNVRIAPRVNPRFNNDMNLLGVILIEPPNKVTFNGHVTITGVIVGSGDLDHYSDENEIYFAGNVTCRPVSELPDSFGALRSLTGTLILAPGFKVSFTGSFETESGTIAASALSFSGDAGGVVKGSVINYGNTELSIGGNTNLRFDRQDAGSSPAGFRKTIRLTCNQSTYTEPAE